MHYQRPTEPKYNHFLCHDHATGKKTLLIGVGKGMEQEEAALLIENPLVLYPPGFLDKFFRLGTESRQAVSSALETLGGTQGRGEGFYAPYWEAALDFIFARYGMTLRDIAYEMGEYYAFDSGKQIYDRLDKLKNCKKPRPETWGTIRELLAYYLLTDDLVTTGRGKIYSFAQMEDQEAAMRSVQNYTPEKIHSLWEEDSGKELKDIILGLTGMPEEMLVETPVQVAFLKECMNPDTIECMEAVIDELHKRQ